MKPSSKAGFYIIALTAALVVPLTVAVWTAPDRSTARAEPQAEAQPRLSQFLRRIRENKTLVEAELKAKRLTREEGQRLRRDLDVLERRARAEVRKGHDLLAKTAKSLEAELEKIRHAPRARGGRLGPRSGIPRPALS